jgi:predicted secreted Zn-dependent protease
MGTFIENIANIIYPFKEFKMPKKTSREMEVRFKISSEKYKLIKKHADRHDESVSSFARHVVMEKVNTLEALSAQSTASEFMNYMKSITEEELKNNK